MVEQLAIGVRLPPDLEGINAETLLRASNIIDMDKLPDLFDVWDSIYNRILVCISIRQFLGEPFLLPTGN